MVREAAPPLKRTRFRRDVKVFLGILTALFVTVIVVLLVMLHRQVRRTEDETRARWREATAAASTAVGSTAAFSQSDLQSLAELARQNSGADALVIERMGMTATSGKRHPGLAEVANTNPVGRVIALFDETELSRRRKTLFLTTIVTATGTVVSCLLLLLYVPKIFRPIEELIDQAQQVEEWSHEKDEARFVIETFRKSIESLRVQESELKDLHLRELTRANDLEQITATLMRSMSSGLLSFDEDGRIVRMNAAAEQLLPIVADPAGLTFSEAIRDPQLTAVLQDAFRSQESIPRKEIDIDGNSGPITVGLTIVPVRTETNALLGMLVLVTDLTPIRNLEERLRDVQSLADLGEISAGIAHEFRNSLSTILGYLKLARRCVEPTEILARVESAEREAMELAATVERLLAFGRPMKPDFQSVDLEPLIRSIMDRITRDDDVVRFTFVPDARIEIQGDPSLLARAFENLLRNAADSVRSKGEGEVTVTLHSQPAPSVTIRDTGIGFDASHASRLFLPFHSQKATGIGMGLPLAKKIILLHGGTLSLTGASGAGAVAHVEFPAPVQSPVRN